MKKITVLALAALLLCIGFAFGVSADAQKSVFIDFKKTYGFSVAQCQSYTFNDNNGILSGVAAAKSETDASSDPCVFFNTSYIIGKNTEFHIRMKHNADVENTTLSVFFAGVKPDGTSFSYGQTSRYDTKISGTSNGKYITYIVPVDTSLFGGTTITNIRLDPLSHAGTFDIDYLMITEGGSDYVWNFQTDGNKEGWWCQAGDVITVKDGAIVYETPEKFEAPYLWISVNLDATAVSGIEVVLKHNLTTDDTTQLRFFYKGTNSSGEAFEMSESYKAATALPSKSGDQAMYYYLDLKDCVNWSGSTIKNLRVDPIGKLGSYEVDRIRLLYDPNNYRPLDTSEMSLSYEFADTTKGSANGDIIIDFAGQETFNAKTVCLNWSYKDNGEYKDLADYSALKVTSGEKLSDGIYSITKGLLIPEGATALSAHITDCEKSFTLNYDLPGSKLPTYKTPEYTVALASDFHFGWWGTENGQPLPIHEKVLSFVDERADFMVVAGDSTTWNGATEKIYEWSGATNYFKRYTIPVYLAQGNHELPTTYPVPEGYSDQYFKDFFNNWISYCETNGFYPEKIERVADDLYYYDTEVKGHHYIFLQIPFTGNFSGFGEDQLEWLDNKLFEKEQSGKPIFIVGHFPMRNTVGNTASSYSNQISDHVAFKAILDKHPTAIYVSGHTHYSLYNEPTSVVDGGLLAPSFINDGGIISQSTQQDDGTEVTTYDNAMAVMAEVCDDRIVLRGYDFSNYKWISSALYQITFNGTTDIKGLSATRSFNGTNTVLSASVSGNDTGVSYTWYADGEVIGTGKNLSVDGDTDAVIAVRAADSKGYASEIAKEEEKTGGIAPYTLGAQVRVPTSTTDTVSQGLRFISSITTDTYRMLSKAGALPKTNEDTGVGFGSVIIPTDFIPQGETLTKETERAYIVPAVNIWKSDSETVKYTVCLTDILKQNYNKRYTVVSYVTYMDGDQEITIYGEQMSASIYAIAKKAAAADSIETEFVKNYLKNTIIKYVDDNEGWTEGIYRP